MKTMKTLFGLGALMSGGLLAYAWGAERPRRRLCRRAAKKRR